MAFITIFPAGFADYSDDDACPRCRVSLAHVRFGNLERLSRRGARAGGRADHGRMILDPRALIDRARSEAEWQAQVQELLDDARLASLPQRRLPPRLPVWLPET